MMGILSKSYLLGESKKLCDGLWGVVAEVEALPVDGGSGGVG